MPNSVLGNSKFRFFPFLVILNSIFFRFATVEYFNVVLYKKNNCGVLSCECLTASSDHLQKFSVNIQFCRPGGMFNVLLLTSEISYITFLHYTETNVMIDGE